MEKNSEEKASPKILNLRLKGGGLVDVVLVSVDDMSIACELSNPNLKKTKAAESSVGKWIIISKILLFRVFCGLLCLSALICLCFSFSSCICNNKQDEAAESSSSSKGMLFRNQNVSRSEIDAMLSLFFDSNQVSPQLLLLMFSIIVDNYLLSFE